MKKAPRPCLTASSSTSFPSSYPGKKKEKRQYYQTVLIVIDIAREGRYLVVHGEDDHQLPENGDEVQEELHTLPSHTNRQTLLTNRIHSQS